MLDDSGEGMVKDLEHKATTGRNSILLPHILRGRAEKIQVDGGKKREHLCNGCYLLDIS